MQKILLVQDMLTNMLLTPVLEKSGFEVIQTSSFQDAKKSIESGTNDECFAVIIDLNLDDTKDGKIVDYMCELDIRTIIYSQEYEYCKVEDLIKKPIVDYTIKKTSEDVNYIAKMLLKLELYKDLNILIVDDSKTTTAMLSEFIKPLFFKNIFKAQDGVEALEIIKKEHDISLVITDFNMPKMDGLELIQNIKKMYSDDKLAIISITSEVKPDISIQFLKFGVGSFLNKPYSKIHLNTIIHNEMEHLFDKQKNLKQKKDLGAFVRKIKTDNMSNNRKYEQDIVDLTIEKTKLKKEKMQLIKQNDLFKTKFDLMQTKLTKQIERLSMKQGEFVANAIDNSRG